MSKARLIKPTPAEDAAIARGIARDPDAMEVSDDAFHEAAAQKRSRGRPRGSVAERRKELVTLRLDADLLASMRATGDGWQTRVNDVLRRWIRRAI